MLRLFQQQTIIYFSLLFRSKMEKEKINIEEKDLIEAIEKIKYGGTIVIINKEGEIVEIKIEKMPPEAIIWE